MSSNINWTDIGHCLRECAMDAHEGWLPPLAVAWDFLLDNPPAFVGEEWPDNMPDEAPLELIAAYYGVRIAPAAQPAAPEVTV